EDINLDEIESKLLGIPNIASLHHLHVWSLEGDHHVFTTHIKLKDINQFQQLLEVKKQVKNVLKQYNFDHYTIETELDKESCDLL
ncbi:MAG TPA: cation transporter, partial [Salinimicrobium sp.]|nr:cation transporter [Salinimicrobium sp.]